MRNNLKIILIISLTIIVFISISLVSAQNQVNYSKRRLIIILDASFSMQKKLDDELKINMAKATILSILETYVGADVGVIAYGHRYASNDVRSCDDIELIKDFSNKVIDFEKIESITGNGRTPIAKSLEYASKFFHPEKLNHIILLSDGIDTCNSDPCETVNELKEKYDNFKIDTVAFTVKGREQDMLNCISKNSDGVIYSAYSLSELRDGINGFFFDRNIDTGELIVEKAPEDVSESMIFIEGGLFIMGDDEPLNNDEAPAHEVFVQSFLMKKTEITNQEYADFLNETEFDRNWIDLKKSSIKYQNEKYLPEKGTENLPVVFVSWYGADAYAKFYGGRLPFEAEWEYAAYGGLEAVRYPWGNEEFVDGKKMANYDYSRTDIKTHSKGVVEVGSYEPNGYGLYDIAGNVWEWCGDWYDENYYETSEKFVPSGPLKGKYKVKRGGSWFNNELSIQIISRGYARPSSTSRDIGFRYIQPIIPDSLTNEDDNTDNND